MNDQALDRIFEVEKELSMRFDAEREKIGAWLDKMNREIEEESREEEQRLVAGLAEGTDRVRDEAFGEATRKKTDADARNRALGAVSDERMREIVLQYLHRILPETQ